MELVMLDTHPLFLGPWLLLISGWTDPRAWAMCSNIEPAITSTPPVQMTLRSLVLVQSLSMNLVEGVSARRFSNPMRFERLLSSLPINLISTNIDLATNFFDIAKSAVALRPMISHTFSVAWHTNRWQAFRAHAMNIWTKVGRGKGV